MGCWASRALADVLAEAIAVVGVLGEQGDVPARAGVLVEVVEEDGRSGGIRDDRIAWGRLYADEVRSEGPDIDAVVGRMAGTDR